MSSNKINFTNEQINDMVSRYNNSESMLSISKTYSCTDAVIRRVLTEAGEYRRTIFDRKKLYSCNEEYFKDINSEDKAYFLGLIASDGCLSSDKIIIQLHIDDIDILEKFKKAIVFDGNIRKYSNEHGSYCGISISSYKNSEYLKSYGICENKTFKICLKSIMDKIPENLTRHFIRGYFDGDGCVSSWISNDGYKRQCFKITLLTRNGYIIKECLGIPNKLIIYKKNPDLCDVVSSSKSMMKKIFSYLYDDSCVFLNRKFKKFTDILN